MVAFMVACLCPVQLFLDEGNYFVHQLSPYFVAVLTCNDDLENMKSLFARMRLLVFLLYPNLRRSGCAVLVCSYPFIQKGLGLYGPIIHYWVMRKKASQTLFVSVYPGCFAANLLQSSCGISTSSFFSFMVFWAMLGPKLLFLGSHLLPHSKVFCRKLPSLSFLSQPKHKFELLFPVTLGFRTQHIGLLHFLLSCWAFRPYFAGLLLSSHEYVKKRVSTKIKPDLWSSVEIYDTIHNFL